MDRQLTLEQIRVLEAHVYACPACRGELFLLEEIGRSLRTMRQVAEPADLTINIMRRVALSPRGVEQPFVLFRPSISEILAAIALATVAMLGIALDQPVVRAAVWPATDGHSSLALFFVSFWNVLGSTNNEALMLGLWVIGALLGVWITLAVAGADMRNVWFRAVVNRLSVW
jgi:anti-sigma factor RsiW